MLKSLLLAAALLAPTAALAAHSDVTVNAGRAVTHFKGVPGKQTLPNWFAPRGKKIIFDTLGNGSYNQSTGWTISNPGGESGFLQWYAFAITPKKNATITEIVEAVSNVSGDDTVTIALMADNGGVPGTVLQQKTVKNLETFGSCCTVAVDHLKTGVPVTAGTTYWIAAILPKKSQYTANNVWNFSNSDTDEGQSAYYTGSWKAAQGEYAAFTVYGK